VDGSPIEERQERPMTVAETSMRIPPIDSTPTATAVTPVAPPATAERVTRDAEGPERPPQPPRPAPDTRTLAFGRTETGGLRIEVYDGAGRLVRSIPPNSAMAKANGGLAWQG